MDGEKNWEMNRIGQIKNLLGTRFDREINLSEIEANVLNMENTWGKGSTNRPISNVSV